MRSVVIGNIWIQLGRRKPRAEQRCHGSARLGLGRRQAVLAADLDDLVGFCPLKGHQTTVRG
jgi:hypothetical protein